MSQVLPEYTVLNNGLKMPWIGFGTFKIPDGDETYQAVRLALDAGYRSFDTAMIYGNESSLGRAIKDSGIPREDLFITTKVWNDDLRSKSTLNAIDVSLDKLQMDYVDLYLVHWPVKGFYVDAWLDMEEIYQDGKASAIGVSNFLIHHLEDILSAGTIIPAVNQVEFHPQLQSPELHAFCKNHAIQLEAWAPLMQGQGLNHPVILELAAKHNKMPAQILIRWDLQKEVVSIPKSTTKEHIHANFDVFDFQLDDADMAQIAAMDQNRRIGADPDKFDF